jgi:tungstate transport system substrate-binding protein
MRRISVPPAKAALFGLLVVAIFIAPPDLSSSKASTGGKVLTDDGAVLSDPAECPSPPATEKELMLATTTSVDATGLLDLLADEFEKDAGIRLKWIAVGTGAALRQARDGNADAVLVHARKLEEEFLREGYGVNRRVVARNFFMIVGPADDPARVSGAPTVVEALSRIKARAAPFVSRGDNSGTHARELDLWALAGGKPDKNYLETGQGMAQTLRVASERRGYCLTDSATFFGVEGLHGLLPVFENSPELENIYAVIAVNPFKVPSVRYEEAMAFIAFLTSPKGQKLIAEFKGTSAGPLFEAIAGRPGVDIVR